MESGMGMGKTLVEAHEHEQEGAWLNPLKDADMLMTNLIPRHRGLGASFFVPPPTTSSRCQGLHASLMMWSSSRPVAVVLHASLMMWSSSRPVAVGLHAYLMMWSSSRPVGLHAYLMMCASVQ